MEETNRQNYFEHQSTEKDFVDSITKKYGEGTLDPSTGAFISNPHSEWIVILCSR